MKERPLISVVLATYNGATYLSEQLESIYNQSYKNIEVIVCDDKSLDTTADILELYHKKHNLNYYINENRLGVINNFAKAISYAKGDYIALSDQDDVWLPEKLQLSFNRIRALENEFSKDIPLLVYSDLKVVDENLNCIASSYWKYRKLDQKKLRLNKILVENFMTGCTSLMNKATAKLALPIPNEALMHDVWLLLVAFCFGKTSYLEDKTILYRQHSNNVIGSVHKNKFQKLDVAFKKIRNNNFSLLNEEIDQAKAFKTIFRDRLKDKNKESQLLDIFVSLKERNFFIRKFLILKHTFYGGTFTRLVNVLLRA